MTRILLLLISMLACNSTACQNTTDKPMLPNPVTKTAETPKAATPAKPAEKQKASKPTAKTTKAATPTKKIARPAKPAGKKPAKPAPKTKSITIAYPGGAVTLRGGVVTSAAIGKARSVKPQHILMAKRAAYVVAVRNAGLFLAGLRIGPGGKIVVEKNAQILSPVTVNNFRETSSRFDKQTLTATVTIEITLPKQNNGK